MPTTAAIDIAPAVADTAGRNVGGGGLAAAHTRPTSETSQQTSSGMIQLSMSTRLHASSPQNSDA